jgi:hypothetical protein
MPLRRRLESLYASECPETEFNNLDNTLRTLKRLSDTFIRLKRYFLVS